MLAPGRTLRLRWLGGNVSYRDAHALQRALWAAGPSADDWLLLLEHAHVYTAGIRTNPEHMLVDPASVGAELLWVDRGGDITYHGPGQLVGYPVLSVPSGPSATPCYVHEVEQVVIDVLVKVGLPNVGRLDGFPGVWVDPGGSNPRKICAVGARHSRQRTMHGFALNVRPDMAMFSHIVPCGIAGKEVTSLAAEGVEVSMAEVVETAFEVATQYWGAGRAVERQDAAMPASMRDGPAVRSPSGPGLRRRGSRRARTASRRPEGLPTAPKALPPPPKALPPPPKALRRPEALPTAQALPPVRSPAGRPEGLSTPPKACRRPRRPSPRPRRPSPRPRRPSFGATCDSRRVRCRKPTGIAPRQR